MEINIKKHLLHFKKPSGTSRGVLYDKPSWILSVQLPNGKVAQGECSVIPGLSPDFTDEIQYESFLSKLQRQFSHWDQGEFKDVALFQDDKWKQFLAEWSAFPSILFGMETLAKEIQHEGSAILFDSAFTRKEVAIPINGLIWMGDEAFMLAQMEEKLAAGFSTIKMKVGAIDWKKEKALLKQLRTRFTADELTLRVDANGAFAPKEAPSKLAELAELDIHSIEQPIMAGQLPEMKTLCATSPIGIALDEELIGIHGKTEKEQLLDFVQPQYIVLKPSLHGGLTGTKEWIELAESRGIAWWMTSALESSIGLNAIAQFTSTFQNDLPQGLGTGGLYTNNFESSLVVENGYLSMNK